MVPKRPDETYNSQMRRDDFIYRLQAAVEDGRSPIQPQHSALDERKMEGGVCEGV
jgi:hypothetical protein